MKPPTFLPPAPLPARPPHPTRTSPRPRPAPPSPSPRPRATLLTPSTPPAPSPTPTPPPTPTTPLAPSHPLPGHPAWRFIGPPLSAGPLPAVVYLALSASQSLDVAPYNAPAHALLALSPVPLRVFSATLPFHGPDVPASAAAFARWAALYASGADPVTSFARRASDVLDSLVADRVVRDRHAFVAGLSRGGLLAGLLAARNRHVRACLGFAPVTVLADLDEFSERALPGERAREKVGRASLLREDVVAELVDMPVRFYMGNYDQRVGTRNAFEVVHLLAESAVERLGVRSPPHEFVMYCSVGKQGHGTPPDVFRAGAEYLVQQINEVEAEMYN